MNYGKLHYIQGLASTAANFIRSEDIERESIGKVLDKIVEELESIMPKTKNEIIKGLHMGIDAIRKSQTTQKEILFAMNQMVNTVEYLERKPCKK